MITFRQILMESASHDASEEAQILEIIKDKLLSLKTEAGKAIVWEVQGTKSAKRFKVLWSELDKIRQSLAQFNIKAVPCYVFNNRKGFVISFSNNREIQFGSSGGQVGSSGNSGHQFETEFQKDLQEYFKNPSTNNLKFPMAIHELVSLVHNSFGSDIIASTHDGGENKKRKVSVNTGKIDVDKDNEDNKDNANIGSTVTDITLHLENGKRVYLSLKVGDAKFLNKGVGSAFPQDEIRKGRITNKAGVELLEMLGIDNYYFCEVYKALDEERDKDKNIPREVKIPHASEGLKKLIEEAIGYGYIMVKKEKTSNKILIQNFLQPEFARAEAESIKDVRVIYPKQGENSKTISVSMTTKHYVITIVIRNRGGAGKFFPTSMDVNYRSRKG